ncbi:recombinase family protein [Geomonas propionica]|uniref:Recombinase family protein n=1 Tax=Geomonas propionica TaxID=2798582 RepID=A0ABS0YXT7_9BACT|nr:recombinase family protein [Geomonas propionica]MBJ6802768.1 recombinase family protein [Geomonas propionica]
MKTYGYIHTTSAKYDLDHQYWGLRAFASNNSLGEVTFCHEPDPVQPNGEKQILSGMVASLQRGDVVIVTEFFRLGDSTMEILDVLSKFAVHGIRVYVTNCGFRLDDNFNAQALAAAVALVNQVEKDLRSNRQTTTEQKAEESKTIGRPAGRLGKSKLDGRENEITALLTDGMSLSAIALTLDVSRPALTNFIRSRHLSD